MLVIKVENKKYVLLSIFILIILMFIVSTTIIDSGSKDVTPLYEAKKKVIPDTLPWYPLVVFGDNRPSDTDQVKLPSVFYNIVRELDMIQPLAIIGTGDHVGKGYEKQYIELYRVFNETRLENIWLAIGNHDVEVYEGWSNWEKYISPEYYYVDDIPGWRIGVVDSETRLSENWRKQLISMYENLGNRSLIIVFHRPVYPDVDHNLGSDRIRVLNSVFKSYGYPKLVLQGHWHGWAYEIRNNVTWIITGGGGAPLYTYSVEKPENGDIVVGKHHYMILILYPNGTYTFYPVQMGIGSISIEKYNETTYIITNNKYDLKGKPIAMPVRIRHEIYGVEINTVLIIPPKSKIHVTYNINGNTVEVLSNATKWYVYQHNISDPDNSPVYLPIDNRVELVIEHVIKTKTTTPIETMYENMTTTTTNTSNTFTISRTGKSSSTIPLNNTSSVTEERGIEPYLFGVMALITVLLIGTITWYYMFRK